MEFESWNRETLIKELKIAMAAANFQSFGGFSGLPVTPSNYSDEMLSQKRNVELRRLYVQFKKQDETFRREYEENLEKERFFNQPVCVADFIYWAKHAYWSIDEAITLLLGKDPRKVTWDEVKEHIPESAFANRFNEIRELAKRYVYLSQLHDPVSPGIFLAWAERMSISIPTELKEAVSTLGIQVTDSKIHYEKASEQYNQLNKLYIDTLKLVQEKNEMIEILNFRISNLERDQQQVDTVDLKETERYSLYKLVSAMAYDGYGYNPKEKKSTFPKEVSVAVTRWLGENIDPDTSRKWLKEACNKYPNQIFSKTE